MKLAPSKHRSGRLHKLPRFCADAGAAVNAELEEDVAHRSILGVPLDSGEIVILVCHRSWWMSAMSGVAAGVVAATVAWLIGRAMGRPVSVTTAGFFGLAVGAAVFVLEHLRRLYVLTDRRVMRDDRRLARSTHVEAPLSSVRTIELVQNDVQVRVGAGTLIFKTDEGVIEWAGVGDAKRVHQIAHDAAKRYGNSMRGM